MIACYFVPKFDVHHDHVTYAYCVLQGGCSLATIKEVMMLVEIYTRINMYSNEFWIIFKYHPVK